MSNTRIFSFMEHDQESRNISISSYKHICNSTCQCALWKLSGTGSKISYFPHLSKINSDWFIPNIYMIHHSWLYFAQMLYLLELDKFSLHLLWDHTLGHLKLIPFYREYILNICSGIAFQRVGIILFFTLVLFPWWCIIQIKMIVP